ncbi:hypothetical protein ACU4GG_40950 [Streptomyces nojiriensis]
MPTLATDLPSRLLLLDLARGLAPLTGRHAAAASAGGRIRVVDVHPAQPVRGHALTLTARTLIAELPDTLQEAAAISQRVTGIPGLESERVPRAAPPEEPPVGGLSAFARKWPCQDFREAGVCHRAPVSLRHR